MRQQSLPEQSPLPPEYGVLATHQHDVESCTEYHVSVIKALSTVMGVDPIESCIELGKYVSIPALDSIIHNDRAYDAEHSVVSFFYRGFAYNLIVVARCDGRIQILDGDSHTPAPNQTESRD